MKIEFLRNLTGANVYSHQPVVVAQVDFEDLSGRKSRDLPGFNDRLLEFLPGLREHYCDHGQPGGLIERLERGTFFNHVLEHTALEMLSLAGIERRRGKFCGSSEKNKSRAVIETTYVETARFVFPVAAELIDAVIEEREFSLEEKVIEVKSVAADTELGPSGRAIVEAAEKRGIPWTRENEYSLVQLGYGKNLHFAQAAVTDLTSSIAAEIAGDKDETKHRLRKFSIPVPFGKVVRDEVEAVRAFEEIGAPVVVKPLDGRQGKGVSLDLAAADEVREAFRSAREYSRKVLVEELFEGSNYRILVVGGKMVAASERLPCHVTGDGEHAIAELIEIENRDPMRGDGHEKPLTKIKITPFLLASMRKAGWKMNDVPPAGERVQLCGGMNLSTGGKAKDVTDEVHPTVKNMCERAARVVNLDVCGIDLVLEDIADPISRGKGGIIEVNSAPGLRMHLFPAEGKPRDAGGAIVEMLYPNRNDGRIPIISITGTNGKTTVTRMIGHILSSAGSKTGMTTTDGIFLSGEQIARGDTTGPISARTILGDPLVEIAVLETARGGIVRRGLGYDWSDVAVLTNISEDHIGQDGIETVEDIIEIKALIAERVRPNGTLVINADDPNSLSVLERERVKMPERKIVFFSLDENNLRLQEHLSENGTAYFVRNDTLIEARGSERTALLPVDSIPVTMNGIADFQTANALAAIAACRACGFLPAAMSALQSFRNEQHNPGRNNLYRVGEGYALIDYGHNAGAFAAICRMAARWQGKQVTGIIGVPGDRSDSLIEEAGRIAARGFHRTIIKEDIDLRGRRSGEVARLLCGVVKEEAPERQCDIVLDEVEAFSRALAELEPDEMVVLFYDKLEPVLEVLERFNARPVPTIKEFTGAPVI